MDSRLRGNDGWWWGGIGDGQPQGLPLRWAGRGLFSEESFMLVVADTTWNENAVGTSQQDPGTGFRPTPE